MLRNIRIREIFSVCTNNTFACTRLYEHCFSGQIALVRLIAIVFLCSIKIPFGTEEVKLLRNTHARLEIWMPT